MFSPTYGTLTKSWRKDGIWPHSLANPIPEFLSTRVAPSVTISPAALQPQHFRLVTVTHSKLTRGLMVEASSQKEGVALSRSFPCTQLAGKRPTFFETKRTGI